MQTQPQVSFDDLPVDDDVRDAALDHVAQLEKMSDQITGCHVVVAQPHRHQREGRLYSVRIDLMVPGGEIVVNRNHPDDHAHENVYVALRDSFDAARRRLEDHMRHLRGAVKRHAARAEGRVARLFPLAGYGFIETPDGREIYFHRHALSPDDFRIANLGTRVHFTEEEGDDGPQAAHVEVVHGTGARGGGPARRRVVCAAPAPARHFMNHLFFESREQAGWMLVERLRAHGVGSDTEKPLVLAIPRGGVEVGAAIARGLGAELDVVLSRKLRAPRQPELALGAVSETGEIHLNHFASAMTDAGDAYVAAERARQMGEIERCKTMFRAIRPQAAIRGRTVIVTDDGLATGATMIAALRTVQAAGAREIIVAVPVGAPDRLDTIRPLCNRIECLIEPTDFWAVGQFFRNFEQVSDERVCDLLRDFSLPATKWTRVVA